MIGTLRRSFRGQLALRFGLTVLAVAAAGSTVGYFALRNLLLDQVDRTLLRLASIEASSAAASADTTVHFHDEVFLRSGSGSDAILNRFAQVWSLSGAPVLRTSNLGDRDLPLSQDVRMRVVTTERPELFSVEWNGDGFRGILYPLGLVGRQHELHLLQVLVSTEQADQVLANFRSLLALLAVAGAAISMALGWWLAGSAIRPVMDTIQQAEAIELTGGKHRIETTAQTEEMDRLVVVLNSMLARIDATFEAERRFLADVGHEIRTPLTVLRGDVEVALRRRRSREEYEGILEQSLEDIKGVSALADDLIMLARGESGALTPELGPIDVEGLLRKVAEKYRGAAASAGAALEVECEPDAVVIGDRQLLQRAIGNLVDNAIKYGTDGGRITLAARPTNAGDVTLTVADRGPGIPESERPNLFDRFERGESGRRRARGSGLGLSIVKTIAETHGASVALRDTEGGGATFELRLQGRT
ncbi:MAG: ATP-binding protein [Gemmatimonadota bacterium]